MRKPIPTCVFAGLVLLTAACQKASTPTAEAAIDPKKYYAVLLINGSVYFGQLAGLGTDFPVLRDVYYVQSNTNPETKAVNNVLIKRGHELHSPDRMIISPKAIVFVEPVGADSKVAQLIAESKRQ
jgi:hypothetical protein